MDTGQLKSIIEAALLAYGQPLGVEQLRELFDEFERPEAAAVRKALAALAADCEGRPVELVEVATGWRLQVRRQFSARLSKLWQERPARYSRALLETLALIAYRQPITRGEIENVRGVTVNPNIVRTLTERGWVRVVGHREVPGHPELLGTTREFLDYFGLKSLDELPPLAELQAMGDFNLQLDLAGTPSAIETSNTEPASELPPESADPAGEDTDLTSVDDDSAEEEELSTAPHGSGELVAAPRDFDS
jgi:segregation and condensation protein B